MWTREDIEWRDQMIRDLRSALKELADARYRCDALAGGIEYMSAHSNAMRVLNQQKSGRKKSPPQRV